MIYLCEGTDSEKLEWFEIVFSVHWSVFKVGFRLADC